MISSTTHSALARFRSALAFHGLRTREAFDELTFTSLNAEARLSLREQRKGQLIQCSICLEEVRLLSNGLEIFNELSLEGYPVVGFGAGFGKSTFDFHWFHPDGADWRISGQRVEGLLQRLAGVTGERPSPARPTARTKRARIYSELVPALFGRAA